MLVPFHFMTVLLLPVVQSGTASAGKYGPFQQIPLNQTQSHMPSGLRSFTSAVQKEDILNIAEANSAPVKHPLGIHALINGLIPRESSYRNIKLAGIASCLSLYNLFSGLNKVINFPHRTECMSEQKAFLSQIRFGRAYLLRK